MVTTITSSTHTYAGQDQQVFDNKWVRNFNTMFNYKFQSTFSRSGASFVTGRL